MDAVTSFIYGMSMMFFSMMAWMFWRKGSERLFRLIMLLMLIADAQCLKDLVLFYYKGFDSTEGWYFTSAVDMFIIPFYSFVLMELVKPGWTTWTKAVVLELPFVLLPLLFLISGANIYFYILSVWGGRLWRHHLRCTLLPHPQVSSPAQGAFLLSGEHQPFLAPCHPGQFLPHPDYLDLELLCHRRRLRQSLYGLLPGYLDVHLLLWVST